MEFKDKIREIYFRERSQSLPSFYPKVRKCFHKYLGLFSWIKRDYTLTYKYVMKKSPH